MTRRRARNRLRRAAPSQVRATGARRSRTGATRPHAAGGRVPAEPASFAPPAEALEAEPAPLCATALRNAGGALRGRGTDGRDRDVRKRRNVPAWTGPFSSGIHRGRAARAVRGSDVRRLSSGATAASCSPKTDSAEFFEGWGAEEGDYGIRMRAERAGTETLGPVAVPPRRASLRVVLGSPETVFAESLRFSRT